MIDSLIPEVPDGSYELLFEAFSWDLPTSFNIAAAVLDHPDPAGDTALVHTDGDGDRHTFTYADLRAATASFAGHLEANGVGQGDRVAVAFPQTPELLVAMLATVARGGVVVPLSVLLGAEVVDYTLDHCGADVLIADETTLDRWPAVNVEMTVASVSGAAYDGPASPLGALRPHVDASTVSAACNRSNTGDAGEFEHVETAPDDPALIMYTSGTSGDPKGVVQGHRYLLGSLPGYQLWFHLFDRETLRDQRVWTPAEWAWAGALFDVVFPALATDSTVVSKVRRTGFDAREALAHAASEGVTRVFLPPTALYDVREDDAHEGIDLSALAVIMCGGEHLDGDLGRWAERTLDVTVNEAYGQTEANALVGNCQALSPAKDGSMGRPYPGHDVVVGGYETMDVGANAPDASDDADAVTETTGELLVETPDPVVFLEYWRDPEATAAAFDDAGRLRTGDAVSCDPDGYLHFRGRVDDLIVTSGYRVSPAEVESALESHPAVDRALVAGVPDDRRGERVVARVVPAAGVKGDEDLSRDLSDHVGAAVGAHKKPREIVYRTALPRTSTGKLDRNSLFE
jgi:acetyl-CoA synthetase